MSESKLNDDWKDVKGYEGLYQVSRSGDVRRVDRPSKMLKPYEGQVYLSKNGKVATLRVCKLVAQAFLENYKTGDVIYHIGDKSDDSLENLSLTVPSFGVGDSWKDVVGYEGSYQVSKDGQIRSLDRFITYVRNGSEQTSLIRGKILTPQVTLDNYLSCALSKDGETKLIFVHRIVAMAFIPNPENKPQVNHIDGNTKNNCVDNLEWATASENMQHAKAAGLWDPKVCGEASRRSTGKPVRCVTDGKEYGSIHAAARAYEMDTESIKESANLGRPRKGFQFEFIRKDEVL